MTLHSTQTDPAAEKAEKVGQVFGRLNRKFEEEETQRRAKSLQIGYFDLRGFPIDEQALALVPRERAEAAWAVPFFKEGSSVKLGAADLDSRELGKLISDMEKQKYQIEIYLVSKSGFASALLNYKKILTPSSVQAHEVAVSTGSEVLGRFQSLEGLGERLAAVSMGEMIAVMIGGALTMRASDIHLEPEKDLLKVRFRVDGVLQDVAHFPKNLFHALLSRIKLLSGLKLNVTNTPQDGRFSAKLEKRNLDLRISVIPSVFGESVVMRILGAEETTPQIESLGLQNKASRVILEELGKPNGMILTTGPTGSGKTTTLYSFLSYLNKPGVKIITLEDPVEFQIGNITQTPVDHGAGMDFAKGLRSILRQDPDIIMVGEIRDLETAETACQAALTGHVVLSTLHTNDAIGAIPRLLDIGVKAVTLAPALNALMAQRLLRRLCPDCRQAHRPSYEEIVRVKSALSQISAASEVKIPDILKFYQSKGCHKCHNIGYRGRIGVFEVFVVNEEVEKLIYDGAQNPALRELAKRQGMITMQQDAILKALAGQTDLAEVWRVTEE